MFHLFIPSYQEEKKCLNIWSRTNETKPNKNSLYTQSHETKLKVGKVCRHREVSDSGKAGLRSTDLFLALMVFPQMKWDRNILVTFYFSELI
jgi:hypothetical protein